MKNICVDLEVTDEEFLSIANTLNFITNGSDEIEIETFFENGFTWSHFLPARIKQFIYNFKLQENSTCIKIKHPQNFIELGETPTQIPEKGLNFFTKDEILHVLYCYALGEVFAWDSIQNGNLVNHIIPIKTNESAPMSSGSKNLFDLHTEDAFHPYAEEFLSLMCVRNPQKTPTIVCDIDDVHIDEDIKNILFEERFIIGANIAHSVKKPVSKRSILFGDRNSPYMRININMIQEDENDKVANNALKILVEKMKGNCSGRLK